MYNFENNTLAIAPAQPPFPFIRGTLCSNGEPASKISDLLFPGKMHYLVRLPHTAFL